jgi:hypothetical protein
MRKHDFSDIEILAMNDCKLLEAGMIYWLKVKKNEPRVDGGDSSPSLKEIQSGFLNSVISVLFLVDEEQMLKGGGAHIATEIEEEPELELEVNFS